MPIERPDIFQIIDTFDVSEDTLTYREYSTTIGVLISEWRRVQAASYEWEGEQVEELEKLEIATAKLVHQQRRLYPAEGVRDTVDDLYRVGPEKPLGYLSLLFFEASGKTPEQVAAELSERGLTCKIFSEQDCHIFGGALYVYDAQLVQNLLDANSQVLEEFGWPNSVDEFIAYMGTHEAPRRSRLFDLIADIFGDTENPGKTMFARVLSI